MPVPTNFSQITHPQQLAPNVGYVVTKRALYSVESILSVARIDTSTYGGSSFITDSEL